MPAPPLPPPPNPAPPLPPPPKPARALAGDAVGWVGPAASLMAGMVTWHAAADPVAGTLALTAHHLPGTDSQLTDRFFRRES
jgi:hypothetical protein